MKAAFEHTPQGPWESFHCEVVRGSSYNATWHFHPEYQLTLVIKSAGYRLVGDNISPLKPGDLVLVGSNLPHVWHQEPTRKKTGFAETAGPERTIVAGRTQRPACFGEAALPGGTPPNGVHAIIVRFLPTFLGPAFLEVPEARPLRRLLKRARRGLEVAGKTRDLVERRLRALPHAAGLERVAILLSILNTLAESDELSPIASAGFAPVLSGEDQGRVQRVTAFIHDHLAEPIHREAVAAEASLSVTAFSRFFKLRTGKTLPQYVNELRVGRACRLLADERVKIADLALACGFQNLANFNRFFRQITRLSPRQYRDQLRRSAA